MLSCRRQGRSLHGRRRGHHLARPAADPLRRHRRPRRALHLLHVLSLVSRCRGPPGPHRRPAPHELCQRPGQRLQRPAPCTSCYCPSCRGYRAVLLRRAGLDPVLSAACPDWRRHPSRSRYARRCPRGQDGPRQALPLRQAPQGWPPPSLAPYPRNQAPPWLRRRGAPGRSAYGDPHQRHRSWTTRVRNLMPQTDMGGGGAGLGPAHRDSRRAMAP